MTSNNKHNKHNKCNNELKPLESKGYELAKAQKQLPILRESLTKYEKSALIRGLTSGLDLPAAAEAAGLSNCNSESLSDLLLDTSVKRAIAEAQHAEIVTTGRMLAWKTLKEIMEDKTAPRAQRYAAARWTLEAAGEGIGSTRSSKQKPKELHEMTEGELVQFISLQQQAVQAQAIDVTPEPDEYGGLL